jgi:hypothetical protein
MGLDLSWLQFGTLPAWVAPTSVLAAVFAVLTYRRHNREKREEDQRRREEQARQVHVITPRWGGQDVFVSTDDDGNRLEDAHEFHRLKLAVHNSSDRPIRQVRIHYIVPAGYYLAKTTRDTEPQNIGPSTRKEWSESLRPELNPRHRIDSPEADEWGLFRLEGLRPHAPGNLPEVWATFQDSDGHLWKRTLNGALEVAAPE